MAAFRTFAGVTDTQVCCHPAPVAYFADIKRRAAALGRDPDHVVIFTGASPVVGQYR
jgi:alkanesulfonate monooxygenase SsuD/methylene tetrahydromethanopterin reductase-like flavin-dependent oxidoreductase (luciferase family)